jgi:hypothetical protein
VEAVFSIYATAEGGEPLWTETQQVSVGADGAYTVLLGAATEKGLPQTVFAAGQARWLGVTVDRAEGLRSPLASVAYAMKAGDAETVGGVAAGSLATKDDLAKLSQTVATAVQALPVVQPQIQVQPEDGPTGSGTMNYVPLWTGSATLGSSGIYQSTAGFVGIGTSTPRGPLELDTGSVGGTNSTMNLVQTNGSSGNYYASIGLYNTNGLIGNLSALGAGYPSGNLFGANDVVFLGGQQKATTNLIFATNTSGALKLATGGFAPANERMRIGATGGVSVGNSYVGTDPGAGNLIVSGKVGVGTTAPAAILEVNGTAKFDGLVTFASGQTFPGGGGSGTITGITTSSPLTGSGTSGSVAIGLSTSALETTLNSVYAQLGVADTFTTAATFSKGLVAHMATGAGTYAVNGAGTSGSAGVYGSSDTGYGVEGSSPSGIGVYGSAFSGNAGFFSNNDTVNPTVAVSNATNGSTSATPIVIQATSFGLNTYGVFSYMYGNGSTALYGSSHGDVDTGSGRVPVGVYGRSDGTDGNGMQAFATGLGGVGIYAEAGAGADSSGTVAAGVYGVGDHGIGVEGFANNESDLYKQIQTAYAPAMAGVWGDTRVSGGSGNLGGVVGTADSNFAGYFYNNSSGFSTLSVQNSNSSGGSGLFKVLKASTPNGTCGIGDGDLSCTGQLKTLASTGGGARTVETYATQSAENWMEDYGTGAMEHGAGVVQIDPAFADTVTADAKYHVFLTPHGDSKGLYVTNLTPTSFEVRESGGGISSLSFDYKIVGKRRGYEAQRLVDVTDRFNVEQAETKRRMPPVNAGLASTTAGGAGMAERLASPSHRFLQPRSVVPNGRPAGISVLPVTPVVPQKQGSPMTPSAQQKPLPKPM